MLNMVIGRIAIDEAVGKKEVDGLGGKRLQRAVEFAFLYLGRRRAYAAGQQRNAR